MVIANKFLLLFICFALYSCALYQKQLTESDIQHGHSQVRAMLTDRPNMAIYTDRNGIKKELTPDDKLWQWAANKFSGQDFNMLISWAKHTPTNNCSLASNNAGMSYVGSIQARQTFLCGKNKDQEIPFEYLWRMVSFELLNIEQAEKFQKIYRDIKSCATITKDEYIRKMLSVEYIASQKSKDFYENIWIPWTEKTSFSSNKSYWFSQRSKLSLEEWIFYIKNNQPSGWSYYSSAYENTIAPFLNNKCPTN